MTRSHIVPIRQPDEHSCGPTSLKMALSILGKRASIVRLIELCQTNRNGTTTNKMVRAIGKLGLSALIMENTTLRHLLSSLHTTPKEKRAVLVSYLYTADDSDSGHWAVVSAFKQSLGRIVLLDSYTGRKTSYNWLEFRRRWIDTNEKQLMIVLARNQNHLPTFSQAYIHA